MKRSKTSKKVRTPKTKATKRPIRTLVPPGQLAQIIAKSEAYTASLQIPVYPDPQSGLLTALNVPVHQISKLVSIDTLAAKGSKGRGKGGKKGKPNPSPQVVHQEVLKAVSSLPLVGREGNLVIGEFNAEFGNASKANYYAQAYEEIVKRHHLIMMEEIDFGFMQTLGKANGYGYFVSQANTRNQAVGILIHPRLRLLQKYEWVSIGNVQGVPDLRPALALTLEDSTTGFVFTAIVVHLKSMRGGPVVTAPIRYQQCQLLVQEVQNAGLTSVIAGGDWNTFLNNTTDTQPLTQAGWKLVYPGDTTSTQVMGGRLDGFFTFQLKVKVGRYQVRNFWKIPALGRSFSDHGLLSIRTMQLVACTPGSSDPDCQPGGSNDPGDNNGTDVVTA